MNLVSRDLKKKKKKGRNQRKNLSRESLMELEKGNNYANYAI